MQLEDLTISLGGGREIIKTYPPSLRISIQSFRTEQTETFYFEKGQDFDHAIILLRRIGFRVQDGIPLELHTCTATKVDPISSHHFGRWRIGGLNNCVVLSRPERARWNLTTLVWLPTHCRLSV